MICFQAWAFREVNMSFDADEEILQDFLVEAGEILELLSEQLVELESSPDDMALLNAIFRGFHTVKGGAGFLQLHELVECCHIAENVFDILRKGERRVDSELMDVVLQALDAVNEMFSQVRERVEPTPASPELLAALARLAEPASADAAPVVPAAPQVVAEPEAEPAGADSEFEQLLDAIQPAASETAASEAEHGPVTDEITDDEFESLLDQLHGGASSRHRLAPQRLRYLLRQMQPLQRPVMKSPMRNSKHFSTSCTAGQVRASRLGRRLVGRSGRRRVRQDSAPAASSDEITDDEFEALLDQLHGKGKFEPAVADASPAEPLRQRRQRRHPRRSPHVPLRQPSRPRQRARRPLRHRPRRTRLRPKSRLPCVSIPRASTRS